LFLGLLLYFFAVNFALNNYMMVEWGNHMFHLSWGGIRTEQGSGWLIIGIYFVVAFAVSRMGSRTSDFIHLLAFLTPITPMFAIAMYKQTGFDFTLWCTATFFLSYFITLLPLNLPLLQTNRGFFTSRNIVNFSVGLGLVLVLLFFAFGGLRYWNLSFDKIYEYRRDASDARGVLLNYGLLNYISAILPLGLAIGIQRRRWIVVAILMVLTIVIFGLSSRRAFLFVGIFTVGVYFLFHSQAPKLYFTLSISALFLILVLYYMTIQNSVLADLLIRRFFFVPAYANFLYWDFFSYNPMVYWSDSKVSLGLIEPTYNLRTPLLIGEHYSSKNFSNTAIRYLSLNSGLFGAGYGHAGVWGMLIYGVLSGFVTSYCNNFGKIVGYPTAATAVSYYFFTVFFTSTDTPAALLSYGFFALVFIFTFWSVPREYPAYVDPGALRSQTHT